MRTRMVALCLLLMAAQPAFALSCLRPSIEQSFAVADAAPEQYVLGLGTLSVPGASGLPPAVSGDQNPQDIKVEGRFTGRLASANGFDHSGDMPVELHITCAGPWCGGVPDGEVLVFLERGDGLHHLTLGPCPQFALSKDDTTEARALSCLAGECDAQQ